MKTRQQKIDFINEVNDKFINAKNHGNSNNWWYPTQNKIAYNVKIHSYVDIKKLREKMSKRQNEYYTDEKLYSTYDHMLEDECEMLVSDINIEFADIEDVNFAGRSSGWFEVEYKNNIDEVDENSISDEINNVYDEAVQLDKFENEVSKWIQNRHDTLEKYIGTDGYYCDIVDNLMDDEDIGEIYKGQALSALNKLQ
jgi:hypothetical protein